LTKTERQAAARAALDAVANPTPPHRRLFFDIETSPNIGFFWRPGYKLSIGHDNIIHERAIICIAWKWEGEDKIYSESWDKNQCDKKLLVSFVKTMHEADEIVTHNGDRFDVPWVRTRCLKHGISMSPDFVSLDTLKSARGKFYFNSNRLDYIAKFMGIGQKKPTGFDLWRDITLNNDKEALATMMDYCEHDVRLLESVWNKLNSYVPAKSGRGDTVRDCPECGSHDTKITKERTSVTGYKKAQLRCSDCRKYFTVAKSRLDKL